MLRPTSLLRAFLLLVGLTAASAATPDQAQGLLVHARSDLAAGRYADAIQRANEAAITFRGQHDAANTGNALTVSGMARTYSGDYPAARREMEEALALARQTHDTAAEVTRLNNLGNISYFTGDYAQDLARLHEAMSIVEAHPAEPWASGRRQLTTANMAVVYQRLGQEQLALDAYLRLRSSHADLAIPEQAQLLGNIGALYRRLGDPIKALDAYREARELYRRQSYQTGEISILNNTGIALALDLARYPEALASFSEAARLATVAGDKAEALHSALYRAEVLSRMGRTKQAEAEFAAVADAARASKMGEELWKALYGMARLTSQNEPSRALVLLREAADLVDTIRASGPAGLRAGFLADKRQVYDLLIGLLAGQPSPDPQAILVALERSRSRAAQDLKHRDPARLTIAAMRETLPPGTTLLDYWIGPDSLAIVRVSRDRSEVTWRPVPGIRKRLKNLYRDLSSPEHPWRESATALATELAPGTWPEGSIIIVADRELSLIPFEILPQGPGLLGDTRVISYEPSATLLDIAARPRAFSPPWRKTLFSLADPAPGAGTGKGLGLAAAPPRLPSARHEAQAAANLLAGRSQNLSGASATRTAFTEGIAAGYPVLHLATHAFSDPEDGQHSWILLAGTQTQDYDYLFPADLAKMDLSRLDLAVLSACETEAGRLTEGEGPATFSRVLLGAGARSVVATLWKVDDASTSVLMRLFYRNLADGESSPEALAHARREFAKLRPHPFYWAAFVMTGDPTVTAPRVVRWTWLVAALLAGLALILLFRRRRA